MYFFPGPTIQHSKRCVYRCFCSLHPPLVHHIHFAPFFSLHVCVFFSLPLLLLYCIAMDLDLCCARSMIVYSTSGYSCLFIDAVWLLLLLLYFPNALNTDCNRHMHCNSFCIQANNNKNRFSIVFLLDRKHANRPDFNEIGASNYDQFITPCNRIGRIRKRSPF